jgi:FlaA1/EpsC-like NDP-sugar epimerase
LNQIFDLHRPDIIFHAAAYKHVPMMESFPDEAIRVNVGGTRNLAECACRYEVGKFVMVSTDKAVNPANVMGATKRVAEEICMSFNGECDTKFISVRFGNVLGSRGSVVPLFMEQISNGGPITLTDPNMKRYFMTIPEAVLLVMQAGAMGDGGEVFVLDMGDPVKIIDMARDLIRLHGLEPDKDIQIKTTGLRPGEKLFEELLNAEEGVIETDHEEIFKAICSSRFAKGELDMKINNLSVIIKSGDLTPIRESLREIVPTYNFKQSDSEKLQVAEEWARSNQGNGHKNGKVKEESIA